ncbi:MAG: phage tail protein [Bacillota bacterium]
MTILQYLTSLLTSPLMAAGQEIRNLIALVAEAAEELRETARRARKLWFPTTAPDSALNLHGAERSLPRLPGETAAAYRARLANAYLFYEAAGTKQGMEAALRAIGYPNVEVYPLYRERQNWTFLDGSRSLDGTWWLGAAHEPAHAEWLEENLPGAWNRFAVFLNSGLAVLDPSEEQRVREVIRLTQPAKGVLHVLYP